MEVKINIDHKELVRDITHEVVKALKPLLKGRREDGSLFTVKSLAEYLQVSEKWVYERVHLKEIPYYKLGGNVRFYKVAVDRWLGETCKVPVAPKDSARTLKAVK